MTEAQDGRVVVIEELGEREKPQDTPLVAAKVRGPSRIGDDIRPPRTLRRKARVFGGVRVRMDRIGRNVAGIVRHETSGRGRESLRTPACGWRSRPASYRGPRCSATNSRMAAMHSSVSGPGKYPKACVVPGKILHSISPPALR
jgi:hypothetical protein